MATAKPRRILVTAGNTIVPIDQVRSITNIFKGRTGTEIACYLGNDGHQVTLLTSNPALAHVVAGRYTDDALLAPTVSGLEIVEYKTYDDLLREMERLIKSGNFDTIIHSSAVSDYYVDGVCIEEEIAPDSGPWTRMITIDSTKKVGSDHEVLYLRLRQTQKIIDLIRALWGFTGTLVKFKLQVGISDKELADIAAASMLHSQADAIVANCLEWSHERAIIISPFNVANTPVLLDQLMYNFVKRGSLPEELLKTLERIWEQKGVSHG